MDPNRSPDKSLSLPEPSQSVSEGTPCPICFTACTTSDEHRICCLPCGHVYGHSCIVKWLKDHKTCPHCKKKATVPKIRLLYVPSARVVLVEPAASDATIRQLQHELKALRGVNKQLLSDKQGLTQARDHLKKEVTPVTPARVSGPLLTPALVDVHAARLPPVTLTLHHVLHCGHKARAVAAKDDVLLLAVDDSTGRGGVLKVSALDQSTVTTWCHERAIKTLAVHPHRAQYLTASHTTITCHALEHCAVLGTWHCPQPVWALAWDHDDAHLFYAGLADGSLLLFDTCQTNSHRLAVPSPVKHPLTCLYYIRAHQHPAPGPHSPPGPVVSAGLLGASLKGCYFWDKRALLQRHVLSVPLRLASTPDIAHVAWDESTATLVFSLVKCAEWPHGCHVMAQFTGTPPAPLVAVRTCQTDSEPKRYCHSALVALPSTLSARETSARSDLLLLVADDDKKQLLWHHVNSGREVQRVDWQRALDTCHEKHVARTLELAPSEPVELAAKSVPSVVMPQRFAQLNEYVLPSAIDTSYYNVPVPSSGACKYVVALSDHYLAVYQLKL